MELDYLNIFKTKYPYISPTDLQIFEGRAKEILIHLLFPSEKTVSKENEHYAYDYYKFWIMSAMQEMIERSGATSAISYSENGINIAYDRSQLSKALIDEIIPFVGVK